MLKKYSAEKLGYKTEITNAIQVARDFLTLVSTYGERMLRGDAYIKHMLTYGD